MESLDEIYNTVIELKYDMRVEFKPKRETDVPGVVRAFFYLRRADGTSELAGEQMVSAQLLQQIDPVTVTAFFQNSADMLINTLGK